MKNLIVAFLVLFVAAFSFADADMTGGFGSEMDWDAIVEHTTREEQEGREVWEKFQAKEISCAGFGDEEFGVLGEYFMGLMAGENHAAMNAMLMRMHGEEGEEEMHIAMGKRLSGCDSAAVFGDAGNGWTPMMNMMTGGWSSPFGFNQSNNPMMGGFGQGIMGSGGSFFFIATWLVWLAVGILAAAWLWKQINKRD